MMPYREGKEIEVCTACQVRSSAAWQRRTRMVSNMLLLLLLVLPLTVSVGTAVSQMNANHFGYGAGAIVFSLTYGIGMLALTIEFWKSKAA